MTLQLVPNVGSQRCARSLLVHKGCTFSKLLRDCAARLGSGSLSSELGTTLCHASSGRSIDGFDGLRDGSIVTMCFAGVEWRPPPSAPIASPECAYDESLLGVRDGLARIAASDPELPALIRAAVPLIITDAPLIGESTRAKWDGAYLQAQLDEQPKSARYSVFVASPGFEPPRFAYHDFSTSTRRSGGYEVPAPPRGPTAARRGRFADFVAWRKAEGDRFYLQMTLVDAPKEWTSGDCVPQTQTKVRAGDAYEELRRDVDGFGWEWLRSVMAHRPQGRCYRQSQLFVGGASGVTPLHFDTYDNLLVQVRGVKRVLLLSPDQFDRCYAFPHNHPQDRQSQLDLARVDAARFPRWRGALACEAELHPGDALHLPPYWWHQVQMMRADGAVPSAAADETHNVSVNFWFDAAPWEEGSPKPAMIDELSGGYVSPELAAQLERLWPTTVSLEPSQLVGLGRDLEQTIANNLGGSNVGALLRKATPEGGASGLGWAPTLTHREMPCVRSLNIQMRSRGFQGAAASEFLHTLYRGRFEGLKTRERETAVPDWWR